jgi:hypothetical protein
VCKMRNFTYHDELQNSKRRPRVEKMMSATSASQSSETSYAFLSSPFRRLANVTCRLILFSIRFSSTFPRPIFSLSLSPIVLGSLLNRRLCDHVLGRDALGAFIYTRLDLLQMLSLDTSLTSSHSLSLSIYT